MHRHFRRSASPASCVLALFLLVVLGSAPLSAQARVLGVGDRVEGQAYGVWYPATILAVRDGQYQLRWDSSSIPEWVGSALVRPMATPTPPPAPSPTEAVPPDPSYTGPMSLRVDDRVEAQWYGLWYPGRVLEVGQGRYQIQWDSNSIPDWVHASRVRRPAGAATGNGAPARPDAPPPARKPAAPTTRPTAAAATFRVGERVAVKYYSVTYEANITAVRPGEYRVHYLDSPSADEWVTADRVSRLEKGNTAGGPPLGRYLCYMPVYENTYLGSFVLRPGGVYQYLTGNRGSGRYSYDAASRAVTFTGGELAGKIVSAEYEDTQQNGPLIMLVFPKGRREGDVQNCLYRP